MRQFCHLPRLRLSQQVFAAAALMVAVSIVGSASAEAEPADPAAALREAEAALQSVDFAAVYASSRRGLTLGNATPVETARLHVLAGTSAALLGHDSESRSHFLAALAIQPTLKLEQDLSPKVRDPYLEALGFWGSRAPRLALTVKHDKRANRLSFQLADPAQIGRKVKVYIRVRGRNDFEAKALDPRPRDRVGLPPEAAQRGFDYYVALLDKDENRLMEVGTEDEPITANGQHTISQSVGRVSSVPGNPTERGSKAWLPITLMSTGLAASGVGVYFNVRRENAAARWNGQGCEQPGQSRIQQCGDVNSERANMERLAIGSYALGGALLASGAAMLWIGVGSSTARGDAQGQTMCTVSPLWLSIGCSGRF